MWVESYFLKPLRVQTQPANFLHHPFPPPSSFHFHYYPSVSRAFLPPETFLLHVLLISKTSIWPGLYAVSITIPVLYLLQESGDKKLLSQLSYRLRPSHLFIWVIYLGISTIFSSCQPTCPNCESRSEKLVEPSHPVTTSTLPVNSADPANTMNLVNSNFSDSSDSCRPSDSSESSNSNEPSERSESSESTMLLLPW